MEVMLFNFMMVDFGLLMWLSAFSPGDIAPLQRS